MASELHHIAHPYAPLGAFSATVCRDCGTRQGICSVMTYNQGLHVKCAPDAGADRGIVASGASPQNTRGVCVSGTRRGTNSCCVAYPQRRSAQSETHAIQFAGLQSIAAPQREQPEASGRARRPSTGRPRPSANPVWLLTGCPVTRLYRTRLSSLLFGKFSVSSFRALERGGLAGSRQIFLLLHLPGGGPPVH